MSDAKKDSIAIAKMRARAAAEQRVKDVKMLPFILGGVVVVVVLLMRKKGG